MVDLADYAGPIRQHEVCRSQKIGNRSALPAYDFLARSAYSEHG